MKIKSVYLDNAASAPLNKKVVKMLRKVDRIQGNPQGEHGEARWALSKLRWARFQVAQALGCNEEEIFFCSGATEANDFAKKIWRMKSDERVHDSLYVNENSYDVWAMSYINNETGNFDGEWYPYDRIFLDLTATVGHIYIDLSKYPQIIGASFSGHKFGALQGVGVIYIRKDEQKRIKKKLPKSPWSLYGGTPNALGIYSLGIAIKDVYDNKNIVKNLKKIDEMRKYIKHSCRKLELKVHGCAHIVNITFNNINGSLAVNLFSNKGIYISVGSACHSGSSEDTPSKILLAEGYTEEEALRTVRVSLSADNTMADIKYFIKNLRDIVDNYDKI